jgi:hypothetical protein
MSNLTGVSHDCVKAPEQSVHFQYSWALYNTNSSIVSLSSNNPYSLCNMDAMCFLWGKAYFSISYLYKLASERQLYMISGSAAGVSSCLCTSLHDIRWLGAAVHQTVS